jgi:hypothetical protein
MRWRREKGIALSTGERGARRGLSGKVAGTHRAGLVQVDICAGRGRNEPIAWWQWRNSG